MAAKQEQVDVRALLEEWAARCPFGPPFFTEHLRAFVRDRCPEPKEGLPLVQIHLTSGEVLEVCHVIGLAPSWLALAVWEHGGEPRLMRTELVPYAAIMRVTIRGHRPGDGRIGFDMSHEPSVWKDPPAGPEEALRIAAQGGG